MKHWLASLSIALLSPLPALLSALPATLLVALPATWLSTLPAHADIAPQSVVMDQTLYRKDIGPTQVDIVSEHVQIFLNKSSECLIKTKYVLRNPGKITLTQVAVPDHGKYVASNEDHYFIVKMNGAIKKVDSYDPKRPLEMNEYDPYKTARWEGWPIKFEPGQTLTLEVTTKYSHRASRHDESRVVVLPPGYETKYEWTDEAEKKLVEMPLDEMNFAFSRQQLWRSDTHPRTLTLVLQDGLTRDNIISMEPAPQVVNNTTLTWNCDPKQDYDPYHVNRRDVEVTYMPSCTNTRLLAIYQKLAAKHPGNATIIADMGNVFASQGRYDKQLALYRHYLLTQKPDTKTTAARAVDRMGKAWAANCDSTGNQKYARQMIAIFTKLIKEPESSYYSDELIAYKRWIKKYGAPVVAARNTARNKPITAPVPARGNR